MTTQELVQRVGEYLDAEAARNDRLAAGKPDREDPLGEARLRLTAAVNGPYAPSQETMITAIREFLLAADSFGRCRALGADVDASARHLERTRGELKEVLEECELKNVLAERCLATTSPRQRSKRILVAVDETKPAEWAVRVAARFATDLAANVMLLHVVQPETSVIEDFVTAQRLDIQHRRQGLELLDSLNRLLPPDVDVSRMLRMGPPAEEIVIAAQEWNADLIVIGTRGRGRVAQFLLGSTAEAVIRRARCPVVAVGHEPAPLQESDEAEWIGVGADLAAPESAHAAAGSADR